MSLKYEIRRLIWELPYQDRSIMMVLLALADYINDEGVCWPGARTAALKARVAIRTFYTAIKRADDDAILIRIRPSGNSRTNRYRFCVEGLRLMCQTQSAVGGTAPSALRAANDEIARQVLIGPQMDRKL